MTTYFVSNAGSNTAPYDTEAKAANALSAIAALPWAANDVVKVSSTHTETAGAAITYTFPTSPGLQILSVTFNGSGTGGLAAGAAISIGASGSVFGFQSGFAYIHGITFNGGTTLSGNSDIVIGNAAAAATHLVFDTCTLAINTSHASANLTIGASISSTSVIHRFDFINCTYSSAGSTSIIIRSGEINLRNFTLSGTAPTTIFDPTIAHQLTFAVEASDLSGVAYTNLISASPARAGFARFRNCKFRSGSNLTTGSFAGPGAFNVVCADCNSGDVQYQYLKECYEGTISTSNSIYADAGNGTDAFSLLMTGNANTRFVHPLVSPEISGFNGSLSSMTTVVEVTNDGTTFTDAQLWQETLAKVTSGVPLGTWNIADRAADVLTAGTNQASSSASWTGTGGFGAEVKQKLESGSFTPAEAGEVATVVKLAANDSVYVSPKIFSATAKQWLSGAGRFVNERASDGGGTIVVPNIIRNICLEGQF